MICFILIADVPCGENCAEGGVCIVKESGSGPADTCECYEGYNKIRSGLLDPCIGV